MFAQDEAFDTFPPCLPIKEGFDVIACCTRSEMLSMQDLSSLTPSFRSIPSPKNLDSDSSWSQAEGKGY